MTKYQLYSHAVRASPSQVPYNRQSHRMLYEITQHRNYPHSNQNHILLCYYLHPLADSQAGKQQKLNTIRFISIPMKIEFN